LPFSSERGSPCERAQHAVHLTETNPSKRALGNKNAAHAQNAHRAHAVKLGF
jgi:hypothetical protein